MTCKVWLNLDEQFQMRRWLNDVCNNQPIFIKKWKKYIRNCWCAPSNQKGEILHFSSPVIKGQMRFWRPSLSVLPSGLNYYKLYTSPWTGFELTTLVAIAQIVVKSNYHVLTTMTAPLSYRSDLPDLLMGKSKTIIYDGVTLMFIIYTSINGD
jgi:hypothetical protein